MISWFPARSSAPNLPVRAARAVVSSPSLREGACPNTPAHSPRDAAREAGQELVEFALILPLLLLLCLGIIEVGRLMLNYNTVANAAREGARHGIAIVDPPSGSSTCSAPANAIIQHACYRTTGLAPGDITIDVDTIGALQVRVDYNFRTVVGDFIPALAEVTLSSTATMQKE